VFPAAKYGGVVNSHGFNNLAISNKREKKNELELRESLSRVLAKFATKEGFEFFNFYVRN